MDDNVALLVSDTTINIYFSFAGSRNFYPISPQIEGLKNTNLEQR